MAQRTAPLALGTPVLVGETDARTGTVIAARWSEALGMIYRVALTSPCGTGTVESFYGDTLADLRLTGPLAA